MNKSVEWQAFIPIILMFVVMYFLVIKPNQRKQKEKQDMLNSVKIGSQVMLECGILGSVVGYKDNLVYLEISPKVIIKCLKSAISAQISSDVDLSRPKQIKESEINSKPLEGELSATTLDNSIVKLKEK